MSTKRESVTGSTVTQALSRRRLLEGLGGALAATACGASNSGGTTNTGGAGGTGTVSAVGGGGASAAGGGPGVSTAGGGATAAGGTNPIGGATGGTGGATTSAGAGGAAPAGGASAGGASAGGASGAGGAAATGTLVSPPWDNVKVQHFTDVLGSDGKSVTVTSTAATCNTVAKEDAAGQGPFFIHELEKSDDISLYRQDIRGQYNPDAAKGIDMELYIRLIDKTKSDAACGMIVPVSEDLEVYIWHTDGQGFYSGFGTRGTSDEQKPDTPYSGVPSSMNLENTDRFCRGIQVTDANGVAAFLSIFPGWYNGRDLHIHIVCFKKGSMSHGRVDYSKSVEPDWVYTNQLYFDPTFSKSVHESAEPYLTRTKLSAYAAAMAADENGNSGIHFTATMSGSKVIAQVQVAVDPT